MVKTRKSHKKQLTHKRNNKRNKGNHKTNKHKTNKHKIYKKKGGRGQRRGWASCFLSSHCHCKKSLSIFYTG